ncbi:MAG: hypothetical protein ACI4EV_07750 [Lachnospiraceae bacterium]
MNLKLVKNANASECHYYNDRLVLQISDDNYVLADYVGKKLTFLDIVDNTQFEIAPTIKKFNFVEVVDISHSDNYVYFISARMVREMAVGVSLYRYSLENDEAKAIYYFEGHIEEFFHKYTMKIFVLDEDYAFIQTNETENGKNYKNRLLVIDDGTTVAVKSALFSNAGITDMVRIKDNIYGLHLGNKSNGRNTDECLVALNVKQFISDLLLEKENITVDVIDEGNNEKSYLYVKAFDDKFIYSRYYFEDGREEIVFYDIVTKNKKVRMSLTDGETSNKEYVYLLNQVPYLLDYANDRYMLINLDTQKQEFVFEPGIDIKAIRNDIIIMQQVAQTGILKRETNVLCGYKWPDMTDEIFREKGSFAGVVTTNDEIIIFMN